jgi:putative phage-type endonuclease
MCILDTEIELDIYLYEFIDETIHSEVGKMHLSRFSQDLIDYIVDHLYELWKVIIGHGDDDCISLIDDDDDDDDILYNDIYDYVVECIAIYFETISTIPPRSEANRYIGYNRLYIERQMNRIEQLRAIPQPKQRTQEWYEFRHGLISASSIGKLFASESQYNSLIYEKCRPYDPTKSAKPVNTDSPLHWGNKYEPLSILLYESRYETQIEDFGCIRHEKYPFIGASPDGINVDPASPKFGRMLEVKNIVNRDITGIPLDAYWIQMQIQMETCDLDECDFLETQFKEYEDEDAFYSTGPVEERGVILYFLKKTRLGIFDDTDSLPHYEYMPLDIELERGQIDRWIMNKRAELREDYVLYNTIYWYLDQFSCVLVRRNREWFSQSVQKIEAAWKTICIERISGYEHRGTKKSRNQTVVMTLNADTTNRQIQNLHMEQGICIIKLE